MSEFSDVNWVLEYQLLDRDDEPHQGLGWSRVWDFNDKVLPVQSLEGILAYVKMAKTGEHHNGHVLFLRGYQSRIRNTITDEIIPGAIFV